MWEIVKSAIALIALEIVLGVDNLVVIAMTAARLPKALQARARAIGLSLAFMIRIALLLGATWVTKHLNEPFCSILGHGFSGRDVLLLGGGLFLLTKASREIREEVGSGNNESELGTKFISFTKAVFQIAILDFVFSLDSVITAVAMAKELWIMIMAISVSIVVMQLIAGKFGEFLERHPSVKILALTFLFAIGVSLVAEGWGEHVDKNYLYACMAFATVYEALNMRRRSNSAKRSARTREVHRTTSPQRVVETTSTNDSII